MNWLIPSVVATLSGTVVLTLTFYYLYTVDRQKYLLIWFIGWCIYTLRFVLMLVLVTAGPDDYSRYLLVSNQFTALLSGMFLMYGTFVFIKRPMHRLWIYLAIAIGLWIFAYGMTDTTLLFLSLPNYLFIGMVFIWTGIMMLRNRPVGGILPAVVGVAFIIWGIHKIDYPFLRSVQWFAPWGYLLGAFIEIIIAIGMILIYLQLAQKELEQVFSMSIDMLCIADMRTSTFIRINPAFTETLGFTEEELKSKPFLEFIHPDDVLNTIDIMESKLQKGEKVINFINRYRCRDGSYRWLSWVSHPKPEKGVTYSVARDISDQKRAEDELRRQAALLEAQANTTTEGLLVVDGSGKKVFQNRRAVDLWKIPQHIADDDDDQAQVRYAMNSTKDPEGFLVKVTDLYNHPEKTLQDEVTLKDGTVLERYSAPVVGKDGQNYGRIWTFRDITARRQAEMENISLQSQLLQAQKMESIGTLAGGIAHDFNNVLSPIIGYAEMLMEISRGDSQQQKYTRAILDSAFRASDLVKQILAFSRQRQRDKTSVKIQDIIQEVLDLIRHSIPASIKIKVDIDASCRPVMANAGQIHQVLLNLIVNAQHAMADDVGIIAIGLNEIDLSGDRLPSVEITPGHYIDLSVSDTGTGMDTAVMMKIFDPFFTTKQIGKGTGLGLSVSYGIVKEHQGLIDVVSTPGQGSTFHVFLPVVVTGAEDVSIPLEKPGLVNRGTEHILLVDDELIIVDMLKSVLTGLGYKVTPQVGSTLALETFRNAPDGFDLVVTDMTMPDMTGVQLAAEIHKIRPRLPVVLCTGFNQQVDEKKATALGINAFLMKPVRRDQLAAAVRRVLDECRNPN